MKTSSRMSKVMTSNCHRPSRAYATSATAAGTGGRAACACGHSQNRRDADHTPSATDAPGASATADSSSRTNILHGAVAAAPPPWQLVTFTAMLNRRCPGKPPVSISVSFEIEPPPTVNVKTGSVKSANTQSGCTATSSRTSCSAALNPCEAVPLLGTQLTLTPTFTASRALLYGAGPLIHERRSRNKTHRCPSGTVRRQVPPTASPRYMGTSQRSAGGELGHHVVQHDHGAECRLRVCRVGRGCVVGRTWRTTFDAQARISVTELSGAQRPGARVLQRGSGPAPDSHTASSAGSSCDVPLNGSVTRELSYGSRAARCCSGSESEIRTPSGDATYASRSSSTGVLPVSLDWR